MATKKTPATKLEADLQASLIAVGSDVPEVASNVIALPRTKIDISNILIDSSEQGTPEWLAARAGYATGSCFQDIIAMSKPDKSGKSRPLKSRETYMWKLATEILYGVPCESPNSQSMQWGKDVEPFAREAYEAETGNTVIEAGFLTRKDFTHKVGVSLDGRVDDDGTIEMKCPKDSTVHVQTWNNGMPEEHRPQVQGGLWVADRDWCDFISYDPRACGDMRLYIERIYRDEAYIAELSANVTSFMAEVMQLVEAIRARVLARAA